MTYIAVAIVTTGVTCALLTVLSYALMHGFEANGADLLRFAVSLISILIATILVPERLGKSARQGSRAAASKSHSFLRAEDCRPACRHSYSVFLRTAPTRQGSFAEMTDFSAHSSGKPPDVVISMLRDLLQFRSGAVFSGRCGSERRLELTLVGDTVNIASRV